jgi:hypothetical protein
MINSSREVVVMIDIDIFGEKGPPPPFLAPSLLQVN